MVISAVYGQKLEKNIHSLDVILEKSLSVHSYLHTRVGVMYLVNCCSLVNRTLALKVF